MGKISIYNFYRELEGLEPAAAFEKIYQWENAIKEVEAKYTSLYKYCDSCGKYVNPKDAKEEKEDGRTVVRCPECGAIWRSIEKMVVFDSLTEKRIRRAALERDARYKVCSAAYVEWLYDRVLAMGSTDALQESGLISKLDEENLCFLNDFFDYVKVAAEDQDVTLASSEGDIHHGPERRVTVKIKDKCFEVVDTLNIIGFYHLTSVSLLESEPENKFVTLV